ncbi:MAG: hypothetical protein WD317_07160 [Balneolaceae bacterium]
MTDRLTVLAMTGFFMLLTGVACSDSSDSHEMDGKPAAVIFDTDMATDCDDAGALAMLHALERKGEATILATVVNNKGDHSAGMVAAINAFYGRPGLLTGAYLGDVVSTEPRPFFAEIAQDTEMYGHTAATRIGFPDAVEVYRRVLADAGPSEVVVVSVGHLNNLHDLLQSGPDRYSSLNGMELVRRKVDHLVVMGGHYPSGREHNFAARESHRFTGAALDRWPTRILFSGYELGENILTGPALNVLDPSHPVYRAYADHPSDPLVNGRQSWDQTAVLAAVRNPEFYWDLSGPGRVTVDEDGSNSWVDDPEGRHLYLIEREVPGPEKVASIIGELMGDMP